MSFEAASRGLFETADRTPWVLQPEGDEMLLLLALVILILALAGGIFLTKFLFLLLLVALIVAVFSRTAA